MRIVGLIVEQKPKKTQGKPKESTPEQTPKKK